MRPIAALVAMLVALAGAAAAALADHAAARVALPILVLVFLVALAYAAAGGPGVLRVAGAMFRRTMLTYLSYRAQIVAIVAWTSLTILIVFFAGGQVLRILIPALASGGDLPRRIIAIFVLGFTTWPIFWKSWEITTLGVRTEQWEGTFEPLVPMPNGVRSLPLGYLLARIPYTVFFQMAVLTALALALPAGALRLTAPRALDLAAVLAIAIVWMWGLGLLFGGLAILYKRMGPIDLVVRTLFVFLAGAFLPIALFPPWAQAVAQALPMTYAYRLIHGVAIDGIPLGELTDSLLVLVSFTVAAVAAGNVVYHHFANKARREGAIAGY